MGRGKARQELTIGGETFYTVERAAAVLHVHYRTMMRYVNQGHVRAAKVGMYHYIALAELRRFLTEGAAPALPPAETVPPKPIQEAVKELQRAVHRKGGK
jgi:excisionase family DNA binding protein